MGQLKQFWEGSNKWLNVKINWELISLFCFKTEVLILHNIDYTILESTLLILNTDIKFSICLKWMYVKNTDLFEDCPHLSVLLVVMYIQQDMIIPW